MDLDVLAAAIDALGERGADAFGDGESMVALQRQLARLEAFASEAAAAFDAAAGWVPDGAHSAAAWMTSRCRLGSRQARATVKRGRALRSLPHCARAWERGDLTGAQVDVFLGLAGGRTAELLSRDEHLLVDQATDLSHADFVAAAAYWRQLADPEGSTMREEERRSRRDVSLGQSVFGMWLGTMTLDPLSGTIVAEELARLERSLFEADWHEAHQRLGREPRIDELSRTSHQRRADALVEMATRSRMVGADGRRPAPLFTILVDYPTLEGRVCALEDGTVVDPSALDRWLTRADFERVVFAPGRRIEVSKQARLFTGAARRAIEVRDRQCTHPMCALPAPRCQVDHIQPYSLGGLTTQENGRLLCPFHNRLRNQRPPPVVPRE